MPVEITRAERFIVCHNCHRAYEVDLHDESRPDKFRITWSPKKLRADGKVNVAFNATCPNCSYEGSYELLNHCHIVRDPSEICLLMALAENAKLIQILNIEISSRAGAWRENQSLRKLNKRLTAEAKTLADVVHVTAGVQVRQPKGSKSKKLAELKPKHGQIYQ